MFDGLRLTKVNLYPLGHVLFSADLAVIAVLWAFLCFDVFTKVEELFVEVSEVSTSSGFDFVFDAFEFSLVSVNLGFEGNKLLGDFWVRMIFAIRAVERSKHGLHAVVVGHVDSVKFVVVASSALYGGADECVHCVFDHVITVDVAGDAAIKLGFRHLGVADEIPGAGRDETSRLNAVAGVGVKGIAGNLLAHKPPVRLVAVEHADDVIAIRPGVGT